MILNVGAWRKQVMIRVHVHEGNKSVGVFSLVGENVFALAFPSEGACVKVPLAWRSFLAM